MPKWNELKTVTKGTLGEAIVDAVLKTRGIIPYYPVFDGPHPFDRLCARLDKSELFIVEVKTKPCRKFYPDTGINVSHYEDYKKIQSAHNIKVMLAFVDEIKKKIYGNWLYKLERARTLKVYFEDREYPRIENGIIFFPLCAMSRIADLNEAEASQLLSLSSRNKSYEY